MRVTIAAQACLLVLNRRGDYFSNLRQILVYPGPFVVDKLHADGSGVLQEQRQALAGESWTLGQVVLSWEDKPRRRRDDDDGRNVVIHEFAHQLDQENGRANGAPPMVGKARRARWSRVLGAEFASACSGPRATASLCFSSSYGAGDPAEFFAVGIGSFLRATRAARRRARRAVPGAERVLSGRSVELVRRLSGDPGACEFRRRKIRALERREQQRRRPCPGMLGPRSCNENLMPPLLSSHLADDLAPREAATPLRWPPLPAFVPALLVFVGYYAGACLGLALTTVMSPASVLWVPGAVLFGALLVAPPQRWAPLIAAAIAAHFAAAWQQRRAGGDRRRLPGQQPGAGRGGQPGGATPRRRRRLLDRLPALRRRPDRGGRGRSGRLLGAEQRLRHRRRMEERRPDLGRLAVAHVREHARVADGRAADGRLVGRAGAVALLGHAAKVRSGAAGAGARRPRLRGPGAERDAAGAAGAPLPAVPAPSVVGDAPRTRADDGLPRLCLAAGRLGRCARPSPVRCGHRRRQPAHPAPVPRLHRAFGADTRRGVRRATGGDARPGPIATAFRAGVPREPECRLDDRQRRTRDRRQRALVSTVRPSARAGSRRDHRSSRPRRRSRGPGIDPLPPGRSRDRGAPGNARARRRRPHPRRRDGDDADTDRRRAVQHRQLRRHRRSHRSREGVARQRPALPLRPRGDARRRLRPRPRDRFDLGEPQRPGPVRLRAGRERRRRPSATGPPRRLGARHHPFHGGRSRRLRHLRDGLPAAPGRRQLRPRARAGVRRVRRRRAGAARHRRRHRHHRAAPARGAGAEAVAGVAPDGDGRARGLDRARDQPAGIGHPQQCRRRGDDAPGGGAAPGRAARCPGRHPQRRPARDRHHPPRPRSRDQARRCTSRSSTSTR